MHTRAKPGAGLERDVLLCGRGESRRAALLAHADACVAPPGQCLRNSGSAGRDVVAEALRIGQCVLNRPLRWQLTGAAGTVSAGRIKRRSVVCRRNAPMMLPAVPAMAHAFAAARSLPIVTGIQGNGGEHRQQEQGAQKNADDLSQPRPMPGEMAARSRFLSLPLQAKTLDAQSAPRPASRKNGLQPLDHWGMAAPGLILRL